MNSWLRILLPLAVFAHGVGHILFLFQALGVAGWGQRAASWLLNGPLGDGPARVIGPLIWLAVILGYLAGLYGYFAQTTWWPGLVASVSALSAVGLLIFWVSTPPVLSALVFDLLLIALLQFVKWPAAA